jgi:hypothetical protein
MAIEDAVADGVISFYEGANNAMFNGTKLDSAFMPALTNTVVINKVNLTPQGTNYGVNIDLKAITAAGGFKENDAILMRLADTTDASIAYKVGFKTMKNASIVDEVVTGDFGADSVIGGSINQQGINAVPYNTSQHQTMLDLTAEIALSSVVASATLTDDHTIHITAVPNTLLQIALMDGGGHATLAQNNAGPVTLYCVASPAGNTTVKTNCNTATAANFMLLKGVNPMDNEPYAKVYYKITGMFMPTKLADLDILNFGATKPELSIIFNSEDPANNPFSVILEDVFIYLMDVEDQFNGGPSMPMFMISQQGGF